MKANFVQKRREDHYPGPYEPPEAKIQRKSVIIMKIPFTLDTLMSSLVKPWSTTMNLNICWNSISDHQNLGQYIDLLKDCF